MALKITTEYTNDYIKFIKNSLIYLCYTEYCKINNNESWNVIFNHVHPVLLYYLHLSTNFQCILLNTTPTPTSSHSHSHSHSHSIPQLTFQEFINEKLNVSAMNQQDYNNFTRSMKNVEFRYNLNKQYNIDIKMKTLKNNIIHIIQLYLSKLSDELHFFSVEEELEITEMTTLYNVVPYLNFVSKNAHNLDGQNDDYTSNTNINITAFTLLEKKAMKLIDTLERAGADKARRRR